MPRYRVEHRYSSSGGGPWIEGDHVELSEEEASWVNRDSEGTLKLVDPQEQARLKREAQEESAQRQKAEKEAKERREAAERIHGVSQSREPGRMDPGVSQEDEEGRSPGGGQGEKAVPAKDDTTIRPVGDEGDSSSSETPTKAPAKRGPGRPRTARKAT